MNNPDDNEVSAEALRQMAEGVGDVWRLVQDDEVILATDQWDLSTEENISHHRLQKKRHESALESYRESTGHWSPVTYGWMEPNIGKTVGVAKQECRQRDMSIFIRRQWKRECQDNDVMREVSRLTDLHGMWRELEPHETMQPRDEYTYSSEARDRLEHEDSHLWWLVPEEGSYKAGPAGLWVGVRYDERKNKKGTVRRRGLPALPKLKFQEVKPYITMTVT